MMDDYKGCDNCLYEFKDEYEEPCSKCRNSILRSDPSFIDTPFLWKRKKDAVNHPSHYNQGKYECFDVMVETFGKEATKNFCLLNAFKYIWRANEKNGSEDVKKAIWYLEKMMEMEDAE